MPVYVLLEEMPYDELVNWTKYFNTRPIGWREDNRAYMLLAAQGVKEKPESLFSSLAIIKQARNKVPEEQRTASSLLSSGLLSRLQSAAASNNIEWKVEE
jgi:hypothetical protein